MSTWKQGAFYETVVKAEYVQTIYDSYVQVCMHHIGVYVSDEHQEDQALFVTEECCFSDLVEGLCSPCPCGLTIKPWAVESIKQVTIL